MKHLKKFSTVLLSSAFCCGLLFSLSVVKTEPLNVLASEEKHADTKAKEYYDNCSNAPDGNYIKPLSEGVDYSLYLNDNVVSDVIMNVAKGGAGYVTSIRNYHNESMNYYTYLRYNSKHNAVGQLGSELIFNASDGSILTRFDLYNGYQVSDAFQIQIFDQETQTYVVEASDQMFSGSNATFAYTFSKPTTSFKIVHYLHSTSAHSVVAWKETRIYYENSKTLTFNSNGGTAINKQIFAESSNDVTVEPVAPTNNLNNNNKMNKSNENNTNSKAKLKEVMTPNLLNYILNLENKSNKSSMSNINNFQTSDVMTKNELSDSNNKNFMESRDDNYNDICNNMCINSQIKEESNEQNNKLKDQINKEIEDMYQLSLKNSKNLNSNKNKNYYNDIIINKKEIIKPLEKSKEYLFEEDEFKQCNTEFI